MEGIVRWFLTKRDRALKDDWFLEVGHRQMLRVWVHEETHIGIWTLKQKPPCIVGCFPYGYFTMLYEQPHYATVFLCARPGLLKRIPLEIIRHYIIPRLIANCFEVKRYE